jgi:hypothetical protein
MDEEPVSPELVRLRVGKLSVSPPISAQKTLLGSIYLVGRRVGLWKKQARRRREGGEGLKL